ncbi:hypothetical protein SAMN02745248_01882 [Hathewaya proteolytica DSM 3090]|uniref:Uncharacterized protein n=1 Tax=Hathewaya proteolytica DSM 3090 TaxID=1121331 RepID=A0A1M6Q3B9_9CLOT|nr:DUF6762 family protein [Hathewaya proteolytica]SHK14749.1 hypothetical protein SAMN02745248_01882 [Hathewaya proteolytica DSM 3090]
MEKEIIVLMEKNKETGEFVREIESYDLENIDLIKGLFAYKDEKGNYHVCITVSTDRDLEDWEYTAFYDYVDFSEFKDLYEDYEELDQEYNPCFRFTLKYNEEKMEEILSSLMDKFVEEQNRVYEEIKDLKDQYISE